MNRFQETLIKVSKKITFKRFALSLLVLFMFSIVFIAFIGSIAFMRHRQLCSYQYRVDSGDLVFDGSIELCPNLMDRNSWSDIFTNIFLRDIDSRFSIGQTNNSFSLNTAGSSCEDLLDPICWIRGNTSQLKQTEDGITNFFIVGSDSQEAIYGTSMNNTDSMMLISIDNKTGGVLYTSFPRDFYLSYYRPNGMYVSYKLNAVYAIDGVQGLNGVIEQVIGQPIHYYAYLNINLFTQIIDSLGGIDIYLDERFEDYFPCGEVPSEIPCRGSYQLFTFEQGQNRFTSFDANVFARSRLYSSDYKRAERQQIIAKAVLKNILNDDSNTLDKINKYLSIYNTFRTKVETNIELADIGAGFALIDILNQDGAQMVLTTQLGGWGNIIVGKGFIQGLGTNIGFKDESYKTFQNFRNGIIRHISFYTEQPKILIKYQDEELRGQINEFISQFGHHGSFDVRLDGELPSGIRVYNMNESSTKSSTQYILNNLSESLLFNVLIDQIEQSDFTEDILIIYNPVVNEETS